MPWMNSTGSLWLVAAKLVARAAAACVCCEVLKSPPPSNVTSNRNMQARRKKGGSAWLFALLIDQIPFFQASKNGQFSGLTPSLERRRLKRSICALNGLRIAGWLCHG